VTRASGSENRRQREPFQETGAESVRPCSVARTKLLSPFALTLVLSACSRDLSAVRGAFREGRLPEAARALRALEAESAEFPPEKRARYALYLGLTHLGLGDAALAERFLTEASALEQRHPGSLARSELGALDAARRSMGLTPVTPARAAPLTAYD
jgi:hypothetical protein